VLGREYEHPATFGGHGRASLGQRIGEERIWRSSGGGQSHSDSGRPDPICLRRRGGSRHEEEGGGGHGSAGPSGALEVTSDGTRFIHFDEPQKIGAALPLWFLLGAAVMALTGTQRIEIVKREE
jgi:hypothetical protein